MQPPIRFLPARKVSSEQRRQARIALLVTGVVVLALTALRALLGPAIELLVPPCPFHALTGWECPLCGVTRGLLELYQSDIPGMFKANPLLFGLGMPLALYWVAGRVRVLTQGRTLPGIKLSRFGWVVVAAMLVVYVVLRNV